MVAGTAVTVERSARGQPPPLATSPVIAFCLNHVPRFPPANAKHGPVLCHRRLRSKQCARRSRNTTCAGPMNHRDQVTRCDSRAPRHTKVACLLPGQLLVGDTPLSRPRSEWLENKNLTRTDDSDALAGHRIAVMLQARLPEGRQGMCRPRLPAVTALTTLSRHGYTQPAKRHLFSQKLLLCLARCTLVSCPGPQLEQPACRGAHYRRRRRPAFRLQPSNVSPTARPVVMTASL